MSNEKYPPLVIELVNKSETNWVMEGTEKSANPQRMAWSSLLRVPPTSKYREDISAKDGGGYKLVPIRHIMGCDFLDPKRQDAEKVMPNNEQDNIWIEGNSMTVLREGSSIATYDYLRLYEGNLSNTKRPPEAEDLFREVIAAEIAKAQTGGFDQKAEAYAILREIRQQSDEEGGYIYDNDKLSVMSTLFELNHLDTPEEKFLELYHIAEESPGIIVSAAMNAKKRLFALIKKAEELNVIGFTDDRAYFTSTNTVILGYKGKPAKNNQINQLADFMLTEDGKVFLNQLDNNVSAAQKQSLARVQA